MLVEKQEKRKTRHKRVRGKISGTSVVPRLFVFRSNKHIYAQVIDDEKGKTLVSANDLEIKKASSGAKKGKIEQADAVGKLIAKKAIANKIKKVVFDRGGYKYHGRVKAVAAGAREEGLNF